MSASLLINTERILGSHSDIGGLTMTIIAYLVWVGAELVACILAILLSLFGAYWYGGKGEEGGTLVALGAILLLWTALSSRHVRLRRDQLTRIILNGIERRLGGIAASIAALGLIAFELWT